MIELKAMLPHYLSRIVRLSSSLLRWAFLVGLSWATCESLVLSASPAAPRPNFVLIMADDLGFSDLGCYGSEIHTPHLDQLAADGVRFTQFYNCAVCMTTRAALLTGLHPRNGRACRIRQDMVSIAEVLREAGYHTALTGKWHLGTKSPYRPIDRGFEEYYGLMGGSCNYFNPSHPEPKVVDGRKKLFVHNEQRITQFPPDFYTTDAFTEHAVQQIQSLAKSDSPFFLHVCYTAPHTPLQAKPADIARYKGRYKMGYFQLREMRHRRQIELGIVDPHWKLSPPDRRIGPFLYDFSVEPWEAIQDRPLEERRMEVYAAMVDCLDQGVGRILEAIDRAGIKDQTLVVFLSDNGGCATRLEHIYSDPYFAAEPGPKESFASPGHGWGWAQNTPFRRYKVWTYEGGIATPMIVRWPKVIRAGSITDQVGHVIDFLPTFAELAATQYPSEYQGNTILPVEGRSLVPVLRGQRREGHPSLCWAHQGNRAIRQGNWKLNWGCTAKKWELYDMEKDRTEMNDLAEQYPSRVAAMSATWQRWANRTEVPEDKTE